MQHGLRSNMDFPSILEHLKQGQAAKRSSFNHIASIRLINPLDTPGVDGPELIYVFMGPNGRIDSDEFEDPKKAKAALAVLQKEHKAKWDKYASNLARWETTPVESRDDIQTKDRPVQPGLPSNYFEVIEVAEVPASRRFRLNNPYMICVTRAGRVEPFTPSVSDLLALDWAIA